MYSHCIQYHRQPSVQPVPTATASNITTPANNCHCSHQLPPELPLRTATVPIIIASIATAASTTDYTGRAATPTVTASNTIQTTATASSITTIHCHCSQYHLLLPHHLQATAPSITKPTATASSITSIHCHNHC